MDWTKLDWPALDRLRGQFLKGPEAGEPYWQGESELASYDLTYGERIGWKWDQVLRELGMRGWRPPAGARQVLDWGCGSGVAGRRTIGAFGAAVFDELLLWDHSPLAVEHAEERARAAFPGLAVGRATAGFLRSGEPCGLLLISHVLNELTESAAEELESLARRARAVIWVEPGTHATSRRLGAIRDRLLDSFRVVAPCTHALGCPMLVPGNERDWCHFFAPPPAGIFADANWVRFGQRAGIDLRSLPYAFIALEAGIPGVPKPYPGCPTGAVVPPEAAGYSRIIGRPEHFKPYARFLNCNANGLTEAQVMKRADPALYKELDRTREPLVYDFKSNT